MLYEAGSASALVCCMLMDRYLQLAAPMLTRVRPCRPRHRFMSSYEQKVEAPDKDWQFLLFAAEPYETIGFKVCAWQDAISHPHQTFLHPCC